MKRGLSAVVLVAFLTDCGGGGGGASSTLPPPASGGVTSGTTPTPPPTSTTTALSIKSVDVTSPSALSAIHISTSGLAVSSPVTVTFANASTGYSYTTNPLRVDASGTIAVGVPLYFDATGNTASATVTLSLTQGSQTTAPTPLNIQDIPQLSAYGTTTGAVSRAYYNYQELALGRQLGALQAVSVSPLNKVSVSQQISNVRMLLTNTIKARNDIDRMILNSSLVIPLATASDGTAINLNAQSIQTQDRILAYYLTTTINPALQPGAAAGFFRRVPDGKRSTSDLTSSLGYALTFISFTKNINDIDKGLQKFASSSSSTSDAILGLAQAIGGIGGIATKLGGAPEFAAAATLIGVAAAAAEVGKSLYETATAVGVVIADSKYGANPATLNSDVSTATNSLLNTALGALDLVNSVVSAPCAQIGCQVTEVFRPGSPSNDVIVEDAIAIAQYKQSLKADGPTSNSIDNELSTPASSPTSGFGEVTGVATVANSNGTSVLVGLPGVVAQQGSTQFSSDMADSQGNYDMFVPLGAPGVNYSQVQVLSYDPVLNKGTSAATIVNLTGITSSTTNAPTSIAPISGSCSDTDAGTPDADDPDCD